MTFSAPNSDNRPPKVLNFALHISKVQSIKDYYAKNEKFLKPRLQELKEKLTEFLNQQ